MPTINRRDVLPIFIIGGGVGLLIQPILANNLPASIPLSMGARIGVFVFFLLFAPFALWVAALLGRLWKSIYQFAQFAAVGTLNSFIDVGIFNLETFLFGSTLISNGLFAAFKAVSFLCATTNSFLWNKYWTFSSTDRANAKQVAGFYSIALVGWGINVSVATLVKAFGPASHVWINIVAPLAGIAASFMWNFIGYKYWVFKKPVADQGTAAA